jgi:hypothetical protein
VELQAIDAGIASAMCSPNAELCDGSMLKIVIDIVRPEEGDARHVIVMGGDDPSERDLIAGDRVRDQRPLCVQLRGHDCDHAL